MRARALKRAGSSDLAVMGTTKETKQDGRNYTGPSERLSSESEPLSRGIHLLQAIAKEQIIFLTFFFCVVQFFPVNKYLY